jgi:hypothetical protein
MGGAGRSLPPKPLLHLVQHIVDQSGFRLRSGEAQGVASGGGLPCDRQALPQVQQPAGAAGDGVGGLSQHILEDGAEGGPLRLRRLAVDGVEGGGEDILVPRLDRGGEGVELADREVGGRGEEGAEAFDHADMVADAGAGGAGERGEEGGDCRVGGVEVALLDGAEDQGGFLPRGDLGAVLVLGDHGGEGVGERGWRAEDGGDGGVAEAGAGGEAAEAGDEAVVVAAAGGGEAPDLDREAEALGRDGALQLGEGLGFQRGAVAEEGEGVDFGNGDGVHGAAPFGREETRGGLRRGLGSDILDREDAVHGLDRALDLGGDGVGLREGDVDLAPLGVGDAEGDLGALAAFDF